MIFVATVLLASFLGGVVSTWLIHIRRRKAGVLVLSTTCAGTALIVAITVAIGGRTAAHAGALGAAYALIPLAGAALVSIPIWIARLVRLIVRFIVKSIFTFSRDALTDLAGLVGKRADQSQNSPRTVSKSSRRGLAFVTLLLIMVFAINAKAISDFAVRIAPKIETVTNILDLISFVLVTPKLFTQETKQSLLNTYIQILNEINYSQLLQINDLFSQLAKSAKLPFASVFDYIGQHMVEFYSVFAETRPFLGSVTIVYVVFSISVILFSALTKDSPEDQDRLADKMLRWGVVVFLYSRALSMMG